MKAWRSLLALCLVLGAIGASKASSLETAAWFPEHPSLEFFPGKVSNVLIGARNPSSKGVNITAAYAQLALVNNPDGNIFNFTGVRYNVPELTTGEETVVEYGIPIPSNMPPRDFFLRVYLWANSGEQFEGVMVFNQTVSVIEESKLIDTELLGLYAILLALLAAAAYGFMNMAQSKGWVKKTKKTVTTTAAADKSEWLKGTAADPSKKK